MDYKSIIDNLTGEITTQQLKEKGLNDYYIKKAIEDNLIERISRGKYKIIKKEEYIFFDKFFMLIMNEEFQKAYNYLINMYNSKYETHNRLYILLLEEILGIKESYIKENNTPIENAEELQINFSFFRHFLNFKKAVEKKNFTEAFLSMKMYGGEEKTNKGSTMKSTKLFSKLINYIYHKNKKANLQVNQEGNKISNEELFNKYFNKFKESLKENKLEKSLTYLNETYEYAEESNKEKIKQLIELIQTYINVTANNLILEEKNIDYKEFSQNYKDIFNCALENQDYIIAFFNVGACLRRDSDNEFLKIYQKILFRMYKTNEQNIKASNPQVVEPIAEVSINREKQILEEIGVEDAPEERTFQKTKEEIEVEVAPEEQILQETKEEIEVKVDPEEQLNISLTLDESPENINELLNKLTYKREYDTLQELIEQLIDKEQDILIKREYISLKGILGDIKHLKTSRPLSRKPSDYKEHGYINKWCFHQARKNRYYEEAYDYLMDCDKSEIMFYDIYKYLIEDIIILEKNYEKQKEIDKYIFGKNNTTADFLKENLEEFEVLLREKIKNAEYDPGILTYNDNLSCSFEEYTLYLIEMLKKVTEQKLDNNSFNIFDNYNKDIVTNFFIALQQGDYIKASEFIFNEKWEEKTRNFPNKNYLILYKKLLAKIIKAMDAQTTKKINCTTVPEIIENESINNLEKIRVAIKRNRDYIGAKQLYEIEGFDFFNDYELNQLNFVSTIQLSDALLLFYKYQKAYRQGDLKQASKYLKEYKETITKTSLDRNLDHHFKKIEILAQEIDKPHFVKRENLYDLALYLFENEKYEECIKILDEHINLEPSLSGKAYLLRGKTNEILSLYEEAETDYINAINISDSPDAYLWLGNIYLSKNKIEEALNLFLEYEKRRPNMDINNIENIYNIYKTTDDTIQTKKYGKILSYMKNNSQ